MHVWRARLAQPPGRASRLTAYLSSEERVRASSFRSEADKQRFRVRRGIARAILARYLGCGPAQVKLHIGPHGKPFLAAESDQVDVRFNLAHSAGLVLLGVACGREIGIDLERIRPVPEADKIAAQFFSPWESISYSQLPAHEKLVAFYACWTRKEAYVKARGEGLALPLDQFDVSVRPGEPAQLLRVGWDAAEACRWSLMSLAPAGGYAGCLAVEGFGWRLACFDYG